MPHYIDMHIHSTYSDGQYTINKILKIVNKLNLRLISITDHDDIRSAIYLKNNSFNNILYVNGVELSSITKINNRLQWLHILGYGYDENNEELYEKLKEKKDIRYCENKKYINDLLSTFSFIDNKIYEKIDCSRFITISKSIYKYLQNERPQYPNYEFQEKDAIRLIKNAGGYPILAHPYQYNITFEEELKLLKELKELGLIGIEKYHSGDSFEGMKNQEKVCDILNLEWTLGSDFHTDYDDYGNRIGYGKNNNLCKDNCSLIKILNKNNKIYGKCR